jgi:hypothetical protein
LFTRNFLDRHSSYAQTTRFETGSEPESKISDLGVLPGTA